MSLKGENDDGDAAKKTEVKPETKPKPDESQLGNGGKAALDKERTSRKDADRAAKAATKRADEAEARIAELETANATDGEKAIAAAEKAAKKETETEVSAKYKRRILESEVLAAATGKLQNPSDAISLLNLDDFDADADVEELRATLAKAITKLIADSPYLRASKVEGDGDGGTKPKPVIDDDKLTPAQRLTRAYEKTSSKK